MGEGLKRARAAAKTTQRSPLERGVRNIIYNVEQNPKAHTVEEILRSLRGALGVSQDEKV